MNWIGIKQSLTISTQTCKTCIDSVWVQQSFVRNNIKDVYHQKINDFITKNNFTKISNNHTNRQQKAIKNAINECKITIRQPDKRKYINMNPKAPHLYGTIKLHKADKPIRPIVNWKNSPGYKLAVHLVKLLEHTIQLPNVFNILTNSMELSKTREATRC
jgi:hypothetical protein